MLLIKPPLNVVHLYPFFQFWFISVLFVKEASVLDSHDDVIKLKHFPRYWPFVRGIYRSSVNSPRKDQWIGDLICSLICAWINSWVNNRDVGDLRRHRARYDVSVMAIISDTRHQHTRARKLEFNIHVGDHHQLTMTVATFVDFVFVNEYKYLYKYVLRYIQIC